MPTTIAQLDQSNQTGDWIHLRRWSEEILKLTGVFDDAGVQIDISFNEGNDYITLEELWFISTDAQGLLGFGARYGSSVWVRARVFDPTSNTSVKVETH